MLASTKRHFRDQSGSSSIKRMVTKMTSLKQVLTIALVTSVATGCATKFNQAHHAESIEQAHPITVDSQVITMTMAPKVGGEALTSIDRARLRAFAGAYLKNGHGPLTITAPAGSESASAVQAGQIKQTLVEAGISPAQLSAANYVPGQSATGDLILSYTHYVATPSACGLWNGLQDRDSRNLRSPNFGCSTQNNLAAMIADPRDLIAPPDMTDPDSEFRILGVEKYRAGTVTSTERDGLIEADTGN